MAVAVETNDDRRRGIPMGWLAGVAAALVIVSIATLTTSRAAFFATTANSGSKFTAGTVTLTDDDANSVFFNMTGMKPGSTSQKCVNVTYAGLAAQVRMYGTVVDGGLAQYLTTSIEEGTGAAGGAGLSCAGFTGGTSLHNASLDAFAVAPGSHQNYGTGLVAFGTSGATSVTAGTRSYRITVTLVDNNNAQGKTADANFTWEAQNV